MANNTIQVNIIDTKWGPYVDRDPVYVGPNEEIEWKYDIQKAKEMNKDKSKEPFFSVDFYPPKPFKGGPFHEGHASSGRPDVPANEHHTYKYSVTTGAGKIDPGVIVRG